MKTFIEKLIAVEERTEIDLDYPNYSGDVRNDITYDEIDSYCDAPSIDIDETINILKKFKKKGANRVYIADHCDHHGYYFYGVKLTEI